MHVRKDKQSRMWWLAGTVVISHSCVIWLPTIALMWSCYEVGIKIGFPYCARNAVNV